MLLEDSHYQEATDFQPETSGLDSSAVLMLGILELLHAEHDRGRAVMPLAAICKRLGLRMSTLQRLMTALTEQELITISTEKERLVAALTPGGEEISSALQAQ
ncbi:hypothetical protein LG201_09105 [Methylobacillus gramineus]|uniref:methyltransferase family protein n=1 Tax=Methylobacillus gramineus TaxID=755169 RepID=UPI001CFFA09A|nr:hypothetical protein [Methylobacillus gramineus]MCB5185360.1 hypothetical protein [Methylobacillus gramineus]